MAREVTPPAESELLCEKCGYGLTGLPPDANCPECGTPAADSSPMRRTPVAWDDRSKPFVGRFLSTTATVLFRPAHFYRTFLTRPAKDASASFAWIHWLLVSMLFALAGWTHMTGAGLPVNELTFVNRYLGWAGLVFLTFAFLLVLTRIAARLTTWEATYRGLRLPLHVVLRGMRFHAAHYLPVGLIAAVTVVGYDDLLQHRILDGSSAITYLYVLSAEVIVTALYLFWTYWIGMRNMMYANA